jgi:hypothetical protein
LGSFSCFQIILKAFCSFFIHQRKIIISFGVDEKEKPRQKIGASQHGKARRQRRDQWENKSEGES